jgi:cell division protein FtsQ
MISFRRLKKKIQNGLQFSWRKKSSHSFRYHGYKPQTYAPFHLMPLQKTTILKAKDKKLISRSVEKIFSRSGGSHGVPNVGNVSQKNDRRLFFTMICLVLIGFSVIAYTGKGWLFGLVSGVEYFEVQENVVIEGCRMTSPAEIRELAEIRYHTNLFSINLGKLEAILVRHPWVSEVKVHRIWPNRLFIRLVEHVPEALIVQGEPGKEKLHYLDEKGVAFIPVTPGQDLDFPVITGVENVQTPERLKETLGDVVHFLKLVKSNNPNLPAQSVSEIHLDKVEGMVVYLVEHPFPIFFGTGSVGKKYKQLQDVLGVLYKQRKEGMVISQVEYIRMDYLTNKVLVAQSGSG